MQERTGQCYCGAVKYSVTGETYGVVSCHCKVCQQLHGNYNPMIVVDKDNVTFLEDSGLSWYETSTEKDRGFCKVCGAALFMRQLQGPKLLISAGSFDETEDFVNVKNIFEEEAGAYYDITEENS